jgi:chemotaxis protein histidine kinase CheA
MSASVGVVDFFILEAGEYIEQLDALLGKAGGSGPEVPPLARAARALRGSATMARQQGISDLAAALERVARALGAHPALPWDAAIGAALVATVDDLRLLLRNVRSWGPADDARVQARIAELHQFAPAAAGSATPPATPPATGGAFLAGEAAELARALDGYLSAPSPDAVTAVAARVRSLRGVADLRDMTPLPEVLDGVEHALKMLQLRAPAPASAKQLALFSAAALVLRRASSDIAARGRPEAELPEMAVFTSAAAALNGDDAAADQIVPIAQLFHSDSGPHVISTAANPPTSAAQRFRLELVSLAEHLRRVIAEARSRITAEQMERSVRDVRQALRALEGTALSFGEQAVARFASEWSARLAPIDNGALATLDTAAGLIADPATGIEDLTRALARLGQPGAAAPHATATRSTAPQSTSPESGAPHAAVPPALPTITAPRAPIRTPTGRDLLEYLQSGIAGFRELERTPLSQPTPVPSDEIVPIEQLLYRGRTALERAAELRAELLRQDGAPAREVVDELLDLVQLALSE